TIGARYRKEATDTTNAPRHLPLWHFADYDDFRAHLPLATTLVGVELDATAFMLPQFRHPERAVYLLGSEDDGLPAFILKDIITVRIPCPTPHSMNVAVAGSLVLYDRFVKCITLVK